MGDSQEKCPHQILTLFIAIDPILSLLNVVCGHFTFIPPRYIQIRIVILIYVA